MSIPMIESRTPIGADDIDRHPPAKYVQSATFDGKPLHATHLSAAGVHRGGRLHLRLGPEPSSGGRSIAPSLSDPPAIPKEA
jgi:putative alpha-1,2-mannosidase